MMVKAKKQLVFIICILTNVFMFGQCKVAITIDDVPNTRKFQRDDFNAKFLKTLDSLNIPVTIFINEGLIYKTKNVSYNFNLLDQWAKKEYTTLGNHTFNHSRYSNVGIDSFTTDINKGENITRELSKLYNKKLKYFRFPYNDLGKDSIQQIQIKNLLHKKNYIITPFTIESVDYMFNNIYNYHLRSGNTKEAELIANQYINKTLEYFAYFDSLAIRQYNRHINQIFLCHDNSINADYFHILIEKLIKEGYSFVSLDEAMQDPVYEQPNNYYKKWGISWIYRWINEKDEIKRLMQHEPDIMETYKIYQKLNSNIE